MVAELLSYITCEKTREVYFLNYKTNSNPQLIYCAERMINGEKHMCLDVIMPIANTKIFFAIIKAIQKFCKNTSRYPTIPNKKNILRIVTMVNC